MLTVDILSIWFIVLKNYAGNIKLTANFVCSLRNNFKKLFTTPSV